MIRISTCGTQEAEGPPIVSMKLVTPAKFDQAQHKKSLLHLEFNLSRSPTRGCLVPSLRSRVLLLSFQHKSRPSLCSVMAESGHSLHWVIATLLMLTTPEPGHAGTYDEATSLMDKLIYRSGYKPQVRPLLNQSDVLRIGVSFELVSVIEVNDVFQSFTCNGFIGFRWYDQILRWNASDYGGVELMTPQSKDIFRPRLALLNTIGERDLFREDNAPVVVHPSGLTSWSPGSMFPVSCKLDLTKYPFDEQTCVLDLLVMEFTAEMLKFEPMTQTVGQNFYTENGEWEVKSTNLSTKFVLVPNDPISSIVVKFTLRRKPEFLVLSILLPLVLLSLLNLMVFVIPVECGEKISFGITVLLALSVFMSIMSDMLPRSAESMPLMIRYIFCLLILSLLTVVDSIIIVRLHHMGEGEKQPLPPAEPKQFPSLLPRVITPTSRQNESPLENRKSSPEDKDSKSVASSRSNSSRSEVKIKGKVKINKYQAVGRHIDHISFVLFGFIWVTVTAEFMVSTDAYL
ncbi:hypothetical protein RRG08_032324 [Elysia crispata]|uniref:Uncharacterized protein n=1 Tax=Elysia crispata TaxID=231223 RepID=A0AAE0ZVW7_9GAST|nr:hypothetical protein RRG08_032324 [Elysia crispata]